jgi:hypothetical protein
MSVRGADELLAGAWIGDVEQFEHATDAVGRIEMALSSIQDAIVDLTYKAWPAQIPEVGLAEPWARIDGQRIVLGFGDILELEPIRLSEIAEPLPSQ